MRKGISPIVAVVLLIAIAVIAAVGLYFWVGGLATKQPTPNTPGTITAICSGATNSHNGTLMVSNTGTTALSGSLTVTGGTYTTSCDSSCNSLAAGASCVCSSTMAAGDSGTVYGASTASAEYNC